MVTWAAPEIWKLVDAQLSAGTGMLPLRLVPSVVDADALLSSVQNQSRRGWQSRLSQVGEAQRSMVFASSHVLPEMYAGFPKLATSSLSVVDLRDCFEGDYLPHIRWVDMADVDDEDERVAAVAAIDHTDVPTAQLACLIAPVVVFSNDHSLTDTGFSSKRWRDLAHSVVEAGEGEIQQETAALAVTLPAWGAFKGVGGLSRGVGLPGWLGPLLLTGGIAWTLRSREQRDIIAQVLGPMVEAAGKFYERQGAITTAISAAALTPAPGRRPKHLVAAVLARSSEPLLAKEIADRIGDDLTMRLVELRSMLTEAPEFVRVGYRWQLGERRHRVNP